MAPDGTPNHLAAALGKVSSGLYIATVNDDGNPAGMLVSFLEQASFQPPMVTLALGQGRFLGDLIRRHSRVGINILGKENGALMKPFLKANDTPFKEVELVENDHGLPQLKDALAFLACRYLTSLPAGDHEVFLLEVVDGTLQSESDDPMVRIRRDGLAY